MLRDYEILEYPIKVDLNTTSLKETRLFFDWFMKNKEARVARLFKIMAGKAFSLDKIIYTVESLTIIDDWFRKHVTTRKMTEEEIERFKSRYFVTIRKGGLDISMADVIKIPEKVLTDEAKSLCWDIGIYFAEVLIRNTKGLEWRLCEKPKNNVDYHHPCIYGFKSPLMNLEPADVINTVALRFSNQEKDSIYDLYYTWKKWANY